MQMSSIFPKEISNEVLKNKRSFEIELNAKCPNGTVFVRQYQWQGYLQTRATFASVLTSKYTNPKNM